MTNYHERGPRSFLSVSIDVASLASFSSSSSHVHAVPLPHEAAPDNVLNGMNTRRRRHCSVVRRERCRRSALLSPSAHPQKRVRPSVRSVRPRPLPSLFSSLWSFITRARTSTSLALTRSLDLATDAERDRQSFLIQPLPLSRRHRHTKSERAVTAE